VVKPTTGTGGRDVSYHVDKKGLSPVVREIRRIIGQRENVVIQKRIFPPPLKVARVPQEISLRGFVSWDEKDSPAYCGTVVRYDQEGRPVNLSLTARPMGVDECFDRLGLRGGWRAELETDITGQGERAFEVLHREARLLRPSARLDLMGVDIIPQTYGSKPIPWLIEVNSDVSGGMGDLDGISPPEEQGAAIRTYCRTIARRARARREADKEFRDNWRRL
jgi:hypothetical protein